MNTINDGVRLWLSCYKLKVFRCCSIFWSDFGITTISNLLLEGKLSFWPRVTFSRSNSGLLWLEELLVLIARSSCFLAFWVTNMTTMTQKNNWQLRTMSPTLAACASPNTSSMDLSVDPRYTLITWHGKSPRHVACRYLSKLIVLTAKSEFCKPNGIGVSLDNNTSWKASFFDSNNKLNLFNIDSGSAISISLSTYLTRKVLIIKWAKIMPRVAEPNVTSIPICIP